MQPVMKAPWRDFAPAYEKPDRRSWTILGDTVLPFMLGCYLMYRALEVSYALTLLLALPTGGFYIRMFAIFHDTVHFIWFKNKTANVILGTILGWMTATPFWQWRAVHARHHVALGNLDRRDEPQIKTLTVREYKALSPGRQRLYRLYRHPIVIIAIGGFFIWIVVQRFVGRARYGFRETASVYATNMVIALTLLAAHYTIGIGPFLMVFVPVSYVGSTVGVWLYYVQHQFEDTYWAPGNEWEFSSSALRGSIFLRVAPWFDWFTGYFTWHAIHHLIPRVPFYRLPECYSKEPYWRQLEEHSLGDAWKAMFLTLWNEDSGRLVGWADAPHGRAHDARLERN